MVENVNYDTKIKTFEGMLMNRVATAFKAMDIGSGELVDEIIEQIEMLFKLKKELNDEYQKAKLNQTSPPCTMDPSCNICGVCGSKIFY